MKITTHSTKETQKFGKSLGQKYKGKPTLITLAGDLGAGKTTFTQGLMLGLGISQKGLSPTFLISREYQIPQTEQIFYHLDLYRFEHDFDTINSGIQELLDNPKDIVLIEWSERLGEKIPSRAIQITITRTGENEREIEVND